MTAVAACPTHPVGTDASLRLLALQLDASGDETYVVSFSPTSGAPFRSGLMRQVDGPSWDIVESSGRSTTVSLGSPNEVFRLALGASHDSRRTVASQVTKAAPHWPTPLTQRLASRGLCGGGTVAFDARWFLAQLPTAAVHQPLLLPDAASKLGLAGLDTASAIVADISTLVDTLLRASSTSASADALEWDGEGRLIGEFSTGELAQLGNDIGEGCQAALGTGPLTVRFEPNEPLGVGLGPLRPVDPREAPPDQDVRESMGMGAYVGEVDPGSAAERAGVMPGMVLSRLSEPDLALPADGPLAMRFEAVLDEIDARRDAGRAVTITFDTAAAATHLYAVEMPAAAALAALVATGEVGRTTQGPTTRPLDVDAGAVLNALCGQALLWREDPPRLFIGEPGSFTCAHTDICPRLELAHGLLGMKILGVASHDATPRLRAEHGGDEQGIDEEATWVPTDRPLTPRQSQLLCDAHMTLALLQDGDLAVFDSGALHFASNGAEGISCALYQGAMTPGAVPRLRLAAAAPGGSHSGTDGAYRHHLFAADLLRLVEPRLALFEARGTPDRGILQEG